MGKTEEEEVGDDEEVEEECEHKWERGICVLCLEVWEPDDFSGATPGDR